MGCYTIQDNDWGGWGEIMKKKKNPKKHKTFKTQLLLLTQINHYLLIFMGRLPGVRFEKNLGFSPKLRDK